MQIEENIPLAPLTTFGIGGPTAFLAYARNAEEIKKALAIARDKSLPVLVLGGGSNMLVPDTGWPGLILKIEVVGIEVRQEGDAALLIAGAGESWDKVVMRAVEGGWWGIENLSGIPGSAGAAPLQNIGAYGSELADTLLWVEVLDTENGKVQKLFHDECGFGYRTSRFKQEAGRFVILRIALRLARDGTPRLSYRDLADAFSKRQTPSLADIRAEVLAIRSRKFPDLSKEGTAGSFFLNPTVSEEEAARLAALVPGLPQFPASAGIKLSLAYLLDKGLGLKGLRVGMARLFERQPLVVVAERNTSARDVIALMNEVKGKVRDAYGIELEPEVRIIADLSDEHKSDS